MTRTPPSSPDGGPPQAALPAPRLSGVAKGLLLMVLSTAAFACMHGAIRHASEGLHPFEIAFFRNFFSLVALTPWLLRLGWSPFRTARPTVHVFRGVINVVSMLCYFTALTITPLALVTALGFTAPLFATLGAMVFLGEKVRLRRWTALVIGFAGTLVVVRPGFEEVGLGPLLVLAASALWACALLIIKAQSRTESSLTITLYMAVVLTPLSLVAAIPYWEWPSWGQLGWMALIGGLGTIGQFALAQSFREAEATVVMPLDFLKLPWAALIGYLAFAEIPDVWTWTGGAMIFAATAYIAVRESRIKGRVEAGRPGTT